MDRSEELMTLDEVAHVSGLKATTIQVLASPSRRERSGAKSRLPEPVQNRPPMWRRGDIEGWLARRSAQARLRANGANRDMPIFRAYYDGQCLHVEYRGGRDLVTHALVPVSKIKLARTAANAFDAVEKMAEGETYRWVEQRKSKPLPSLPKPSPA